MVCTWGQGQGRTESLRRLPGGAVPTRKEQVEINQSGERMGECAGSEHMWEEKEPDYLVTCRLVDMADVTAPEKWGV